MKQALNCHSATSPWRKCRAWLGNGVRKQQLLWNAAGLQRKPNNHYNRCLFCEENPNQIRAREVFQSVLSFLRGFPSWIPALSIYSRLFSGCLYSKSLEEKPGCSQGKKVAKCQTKPCYVSITNHHVRPYANIPRKTSTNTTVSDDFFCFTVYLRELKMMKRNSFRNVKTGWNS